jgi:hypothetical protein
VSAFQPNASYLHVYMTPLVRAIMHPKNPRSALSD